MKSLFFALIVVFLTSCDNPMSNSQLIGKWIYEEADDTVIIQFFPDQTGIETYLDYELEFKWRIWRGRLEVDFFEFSDHSFIYENLVGSIHEQAPLLRPSFAFYFLDESDREILILHDGHGDHFHFLLEFSRVHEQE